MIQPIEHESPFTLTRGHLEERSGVRLRSSVSLLVHLEAVLSRRRIRGQEALELVGHLHLPELRAEISFGGHGGNGNGTANGEYGHRATVEVVEHRFALEIPLQYLALPTRQDCDVWALTPAPQYSPPWMERYAGLLEDEPLTFDQHFPVDATLDVVFAPEDCQDGRGVNVHVTGEMRFERSTHMRVLFRDPNQSTAPPSESESDEAVLIPAGARVPIRRQAVSHLAGHDPRLTVRVIEAHGRVVCVEQALCGAGTDTS